MPRHFCIVISVAILTGFALIGCATKKEQVAELVHKGKYVEANALLRDLTAGDRSTPEMKFLSAKVSAGMLSDSASTLADNQEFLRALALLSDRMDQFFIFPQIQDSLRRLMLNWALTGASASEQWGDHISAYNCLAFVGDIKQMISPKQAAFVDGVKKAMLSGTWEGESGKHKLHITMHLEALTSSSFIGWALFKETSIRSELQNGFFNGSELSASYPIRISRYQQTLQGIKGRYDNGALVMSFPIVITDVHSTEYGGGTGTTYYSHIVKEMCVMRKTKGL